MIENSRVKQETQVLSLGGEDPPEKGIASHSDILAWRIPWTEEPDRLQSIELHGVRHDRSDLARIQSLDKDKNLCIYFMPG